MSIGLRIKEIRKLHNLNQEEFASSIGLSRVYIGQVETGIKNISDRAINDICRKYIVNKEWLVTGSGSMQGNQPEVEVLTNFFADILNEDEKSFKRQFILKLAELPPDKWAVMSDLLEMLLITSKS